MTDWIHGHCMVTWFAATAHQRKISLSLEEYSQWRQLSKLKEVFQATNGNSKVCSTCKGIWKWKPISIKLAYPQIWCLNSCNILSQRDNHLLDKSVVCIRLDVRRFFRTKLHVRDQKVGNNLLYSLVKTKFKHFVWVSELKSWEGMSLVIETTVPQIVWPLRTGLHQGVSAPNPNS